MEEIVFKGIYIGFFGLMGLFTVVAILADNAGD